MKSPPSLIMKATSQKTIKFSIMVTTISLMSNLPLRKPAIAPRRCAAHGRRDNHEGDDECRETGQPETLSAKGNRSAKAARAPA